MTEGTAALRVAASHWSLAGDQQLLDILQNIHQRILSKCNETTARLDAMARGLRDASVNLQNVSNKFLALSNTQFVESRVYDDDADMTAAPDPSKEPAQLKDATSDLSTLKHGLQLLERYHEPLHILRDSDSDSDSDGADDRLVLKPKDLYSDRPLPYIIGSQAWKNKWHAGLVQEESDSDSSVSKAEEVEQYSESEGENEIREKERDYQPARKISTGSSSTQSEVVSVSPVRPTPSDVAAELARRLGGEAKMPGREPVHGEPDTVVRKLYKPQQPVATTIFLEEPPPLDEASSDDDIFAELHKTQPSAYSNSVQSDLFDFTPKANSLEDALFGNQRSHEINQTANARPPLFEEEKTPKNVTRERETREQDDNIKKPAGGISLFGTNQNAENIGAAILRRRRKSSNSDESNTEEVADVKEVPEVKRERDIFDDLFAKSEKLNNKSTKIDVVLPKEEVKKKDVFSDLFDDIDDIFSTDIVNVQIKETKQNEEPLFADDDDLFAEISKVKKGTEKTKAQIIEKSDLFNDVKQKVENHDHKDKNRSQNEIVHQVKKLSKGLFDSDSDDGRTTNVAKNIVKENVNKTHNPVENNITDIFGESDEGDELFAKNKSLIKGKEENKKVSKAAEIRKNALFDSDDELFTKKNKNNNRQEKYGKKNDNLSKAAEISKNSLFDSDDVLFTTKTEQHRAQALGINKNDIFEDNDDKTFDTTLKKPEKESLDENNLKVDSAEDLFNTKEKSKALKVIESINNDIFNDGDELFKKTESSNESKVITSHDSVDDKLISTVKSLTNENDSFTGSAETEIQSDIYTDVDNKFESEQVNSIIFNHPDVQTVNILRTTRIASDEENMQTDKEKQALFDDSDDELFQKSPKFKNNSEPASPKLPKSEKNEIFSDIFDDAPPLFEKPKEPKKSSNVNALFDDDSDDEALFFKKNDIIIDEKPDFSPSEEKFCLFYEEPPAIDVDFIQKSNEFSQQGAKDKSLGHRDEEVDGSSLKPDLIKYSKVEIDITTTQDTQDSTDNITKAPKKVGKLKTRNFNINVNTLLPGASPKKKPNVNTDGQTASNENLHTIDKIEPKMVKSISFDGPEILDNKISKERAKIQVKRRPSTRRARKEAVRKSTTDLTDSNCDNSNDSSVKDKIKDTVVKTVYILNDDDIFGNTTEKNDHISGTVSTKKHLNIVDSDEELFKKPEHNDETDSKLIKESESKKDNLNDNVESKYFLDSDDNDLFKIEVEVKTDNKVQNEKKTFLESDDDDNLFTQTTVKVSSTTVDANVSQSSAVSDYKSLKNIETEINEIKKVIKSKSFFDSDDNDDLFTNKNAQETKTNMKSSINSDVEDLFTNSNKGIETLGKVYETKDIKDVPANIEHKAHSIFDDFPPNPPEKVENMNTKRKELKEPTNVKQPALKSILDDSSDEDDLFKNKTKLATKKEVKNLFGDLDDGDDLFSTKAVKEQHQEAPTPQTSKETKSAETVFVDPLSLFGNDD